MKILIVSSTYMIAFNQRKWVQLLTIDPDLQIKLVTPEWLPTSFGPRGREWHPTIDTRVVPELRSFFNRTHMSYLVDPFALAGLMHRFKPDRIHIEEDPYSVIGFETVLLARMYARQARISFFLWDNLAREPRGIKGSLKRILNRFGLGHADLVICGNRQARVQLHEKKGFSKRSLVLPQLGLTDAEHAGGRNMKLRDELGLAPETVLIGYAGRMVPEKGIMTLLEAFKRLGDCDCKLLLLGSGPMEVEIQSYCEEYLSGRVIRIAVVPHEQVPAYIRALDLFVLASLSTPKWVEQFGIVLAQAMLAGVPCVGSTSGAIPEVIGPGGVIFSEGNVAALTDQLRRLVDSAAERIQLGKKARAFAQAHYTQEAVASAYLAAFQSNNPSLSK